MSFCNSIGVGTGPGMNQELFGIEVEVERLLLAEHTLWRHGEPPADPALIAAKSFWRFIEDGSLRNRGIEFVSLPITAAQAEAQLGLIGRLFERGLVESGPRTGVHVHVNALPLSTEELTRLLTTYLLAEPLLFQVVGEERAHSIYCIPLADTPNEVKRIARALRAAREDCWLDAREWVGGACKYSALNVGPLVSYGTVEFRHAPTYSTTAGLVNWFNLVRAVSRATLNAENIGEAATVLGDALEPWKIDWAKYYKDIKRKDLLGVAASLQPCTYKPIEWGRPASFMFPRTEKPKDKRLEELLVAETPRARVGTARLWANAAGDAVTYTTTTTTTADPANFGGHMFDWATLEVGAGARPQVPPPPEDVLDDDDDEPEYFPSDYDDDQYEEEP